MRKLTILALAAAAVAAFLKRQRDREFDESIWEEPRGAGHASGPPLGALSSIGRAPPLQGGGRRFDSGRVHHLTLQSLRSRERA